MPPKHKFLVVYLATMRYCINDEHGDVTVVPGLVAGGRQPFRYGNVDEVLAEMEEGSSLLVAGGCQPFRYGNVDEILAEIDEGLSLLMPKLNERKIEVEEESLRIKKNKGKWKTAGLLLSLTLSNMNFIAIMLAKLTKQNAEALCVIEGINFLISAMTTAELWLIKTSNEKGVELEQEKSLLSKITDGCSLSLLMLPNLWQIRVTAENLKLLRANLRAARNHRSAGTEEVLKADLRNEIAKLATMVNTEEQKVKMAARFFITIVGN